MKRATRSPVTAFFAGVAATLCVTALVAGSAGWAASRYQDLSLFASVLDLVRRNYVEPVDEHELMESALQRPAAFELDPHSAFMSQRRLRRDAGRYEEASSTASASRSPRAGRLHRGRVADRGHAGRIRAGVEAHDQITEICPTEVPRSGRRARRAGAPRA